MKTMFNINTLVRDNIRQLEPYTVWRDDYLKNDKVAFLDNCENNFGSAIGKGYERYPPSNQKELKQVIADYKKIDTGQLVLGNGSDELIDLLMRCFCEPGKDSILICEPTFGMFRIYAQMNDISVLNAPLIKETFLFDDDLILNTIQVTTKLIFICSPNNPTGTSISINQIKKLATNFSGILVIDEAYIDFSSKESALTLLGEFKNIVILQTFSKAWGLASLRVGVAYGDPKLISVLNMVRPPFNISGSSQNLLLEALQKIECKNNLVAKILQQKKILFNELQLLPFVKHVVESDANYFLLEVNDATRVQSYLLDNLVLVSNRSSLLNCTNYLRISVGNEQENIKLINLLKQYN